MIDPPRSPDSMRELLIAIRGASCMSAFIGMLAVPVLMLIMPMTSDVPLLIAAASGVFSWVTLLTYIGSRELE